MTAAAHQLPTHILCSNLSPKNILIDRADVDADTAPGKRNLASPRISQAWIALVSMRSRLAASALTLLYSIVSTILIYY